jgi:DNA-binding Xre family transcriptional regulator
MAKHLVTTNKVFRELFHSLKVTQMEFGHMTETDRHSVHDWLKAKNEMKLSTLERICKPLGYKVSIKIIKDEE